MHLPNHVNTSQSNAKYHTMFGTASLVFRSCCNGPIVHLPPGGSLWMWRSKSVLTSSRAQLPSRPIVAELLKFDPIRVINNMRGSVD